jgi:imidazole glycerol-phosphate synthase subunit HisH
MMKEVTIVDYGMGNLWSVKSAFEFLGCSAVITDELIKITSAKILILPGVGSYRRAMEILSSKKIDQAIVKAVNLSDVKILGICLGMQLLGQSSNEDGETKGLGVFNSRSEKFNSDLHHNFKIPHVGFNSVMSTADSRLFRHLGPESEFYFTHSYKMSFDNLEGVKAITNHSVDFLSAYEKDNVFATQFHPEKSQTNGLQLLWNFLEA